MKTIARCALACAGLVSLAVGVVETPSSAFWHETGTEVGRVRSSEGVAIRGLSVNIQSLFAPLDVGRLLLGEHQRTSWRTIGNAGPNGTTNSRHIGLLSSLRPTLGVIDGLELLGSPHDAHTGRNIGLKCWTLPEVLPHQIHTDWRSLLDLLNLARTFQFLNADPGALVVAGQTQGAYEQPDLHSGDESKKNSADRREPIGPRRPFTLHWYVVIWRWHSWFILLVGAVCSLGRSLSPAIFYEVRGVCVLPAVGVLRAGHARRWQETSSCPTNRVTCESGSPVARRSAPVRLSSRG